MNAEEIKSIAKKIRIAVLNMAVPVRAAHIGSSLSAADVLATLYFDVLRVDPKNPTDPERDIFILSKGHAGAGLYAALAYRGFFDPEEFKQYYTNGTIFLGHSTKNGLPGVETSTGSLGHGLPVGLGMALAAKRSGSSRRVFVMLSDGELDEGSNWEAILFAGHHHLDNLTVIVDYNKIQSFGRTAEVLNLEPLADKWVSFNWGVSEVDGHDIPALMATFATLPFEQSKPNVIIAHTVKGKGWKAMEDKLESHYMQPSAEELPGVIADIEAS